MSRYRDRIGLVLLLGLVPGCVLTDNSQVDLALAEQALRRVAPDRPPRALAGSPGTPPPLAAIDRPQACRVALHVRPAGEEDGSIRQAAAQREQPPGPRLTVPPGAREGQPARPRLTIPPGLPGANAPSLSRSRWFVDETIAEFIAREYPPLEPLPPAPRLPPGPNGQPLTLDDLQRIGLLYSPAIKRAQAAVDAARGAVKDAGAYPNPNVGFEHDTAQTQVAGYEGFFIEQLIKTAGKLKLKQASALMDLLNAEVALRRAKTDLFYAIRSNYFQVLVARENARISATLAQFAGEIYLVQISLLRFRFAAPYEPMQLRPLVYQARFNLQQARNADLANWRQLAAALGLADMPPAQLAGRVDMPVPHFDYDRVLAHLLAYHTDVLTAENTIRQGQYNLALEKVNPIPDIDVRLLFQRDYTNAPFNQISPSFTAGILLPVWDQNKGKIIQMRGNLAQAVANIAVTRNNLVTTLADAMNRYETARLQAAMTLRQVEDQTRVYQNIYNRRNALGEAAISFGDLVAAEQTLVGYVAGYVTALGAQWQAVVDVANLLQSDDLYEEGQVPPGSAGPGRPGAACAPVAGRVPLPGPLPLEGMPRQTVMPPGSPPRLTPKAGG